MPATALLACTKAATAFLYDPWAARQSSLDSWSLPSAVCRKASSSDASKPAKVWGRDRSASSVRFSSCESCKARSSSSRSRRSYSTWRCWSCAAVDCDTFMASSTALASSAWQARSRCNLLKNRRKLMTSATHVSRSSSVEHANVSFVSFASSSIELPKTQNAPTLPAVRLSHASALPSLTSMLPFSLVPTAAQRRHPSALRSTSTALHCEARPTSPLLYIRALMTDNP
mmetsp:Transcript_13346/g.35451  ORF Transcript_13346/g.35451 Transcript_13346/m.35451 type:complete len:229 (+) Transcript_13346:236-922(+)